MTEEQSFGRRVRDRRKAQGIDQRTLAERVERRLRELGSRGFDVTYLSKIENERVEPPSPEIVRALAAELELDPDDLLALAGKFLPNLGRQLRESPGARTFFRSVQETPLTEADWANLAERVRELKEKP